jgi:phage antirepressor YoqD-like protein
MSNIVIDNNVASHVKDDFNISIFEVVNNKVNLTKICQSFNKDIRKWTKQEGIKALISALEEAEPNVAHLEIINGVGTFGTREVAIELARWISPKFAVWANKQIDTLLQTGKIELAQPSYTINDPIARAKAWIAEQEQALHERAELTKQLDQAKPAIEFTEAVNNAQNTITVAELAQNFGTGAIRMWQWLKQNSYVQQNRQPYQKYIENGVFIVQEKVFEKKIKNKINKKGELIQKDEFIKTTYYQTRITGKGQIFLQKRYFKDTVIYS